MAGLQFAAHEALAVFRADHLGSRHMFGHGGEADTS